MRLRVRVCGLECVHAAQSACVRVRGRARAVTGACVYFAGNQSQLIGWASIPGEALQVDSHPSADKGSLLLLSHFPFRALKFKIPPIIRLKSTSFEGN